MSFAGRPDEVWILKSPKAGRGNQRGEVDRLVSQLEERGIQVTCTDRLAELSLRAAEHQEASGRWLVVTAGGDGTLSIAASRLASSVPLVPMPMGTENLLAKHYGFSSNPDEVVATIDDGQDRQIDAGLATKLNRKGELHGRPQLFLVMATAGFDAEVVRNVHLRRRGHVSRWTYTKPIMRTMLRYSFPLIRTRVGDSELSKTNAMLEAAWAMAFNLPCYAASLTISPATVDDDGQLDVLNLHGRSLMTGLSYFASILRRRLLKRSDIQVARSASVTWQSTARVPFQLDGDYAGHLPVRLESLPGRICLRMPAR